MCDCKDINLKVTGPDGFLLKAYGDEIREAHEKIESAIAGGRLEEYNSETFLRTDAWIPEYLRPMFIRIYVTEGGWSYLCTRYGDGARLYPPTLE